MALNTDTALTTTAPPHGRPGPAPFWVWLLVLGLVATAVYGGYLALSNHQRYFDTETARQALEMDKARLSSSVAGIRQQLEHASMARDEAETARQQARATADAATARFGDLQGQISAQQERIKVLQGAVTAAEETARQATAAKAALENEVEGLKGRLNEIQTKLDAALKDLTHAQEQSQSQAAAP